MSYNGCEVGSGTCTQPDAHNSETCYERYFELEWEGARAPQPMSYAEWSKVPTLRPERTDAPTPDAKLCDWFVLCDNPATGYVWHPALGYVATCERCAQRHALVLFRGSVAPQQPPTFHCECDTPEPRFGNITRAWFCYVCGCDLSDAQVTAMNVTSPGVAR